MFRYDSRYYGSMLTVAWTIMGKAMPPYFYCLFGFLLVAIGGTTHC
ncbi:hypothetical protein JCM19274_5367 [Algibacter lectus]|uniref:Uncharacterized protein n=1 Tax=Algibacter lectus TaxID=221126 RepID=A0A090WQJ2_9FLAO|nr:hypothetical protein JCM19274_5367 [Algibacter lectus]